MASSKWKTYEELKEKTKGKKVIFWGSSYWIKRTLNKIKIPVAYIVDVNKFKQETTYNGFKVYSPQRLKKEDKNKIYVIISTGTSYMDVIDELHKMGFVMGDQFCCSPELNLKKHKNKLLSHQATILVSSPEHNFDDENGGGVYKYSINPEKIEKVYSGKCRGLTRERDLFYVVDMLRGVIILNSNFKEIDVIKFQKNAEPHGIAIDVESQQLFLGQPGRDSIGIYSLKTKKLLNEFFISHKWKINKEDNHHINDLYIHKNSLFATVFSFSGNWLYEIYDGGVLELDKSTGKIIGPVISNLWMPHSILKIEEKLSCLNSMLSELHSGSHTILGTFQGFARGLGYDGEYFYIGITEHRYPEKLQGILNNIGLNCGFYLFDANTKMSKFFNFKNDTSIYSIIIL